jgi:thiopurine S-methyltransferase
MAEDWLARWEQGRTGWHESGGNSALRTYWPELPGDSRVLVPLCGKTPDLLWLESRKLDVTGIELSPLAAKAFFSENGFEYSVSRKDGFQVYSGGDRKITIYCGDYFRSDSLSMRSRSWCLVALPAGIRGTYARIRTACSARCSALLITLEYDQAIADGPPYSVAPMKFGTTGRCFAGCPKKTIWKTARRNFVRPDSIRL